jgi:hypothetical protein
VSSLGPGCGSSTGRRSRPRLRAAVGRKLDELLNGELRAASPADIERVGRERLGALTVAEVSRWRGDRTELMERGLAEVDAPAGR